MSLSKKTLGPKIVPWGTPPLGRPICEYSFPIFTCYVLLNNNAATQRITWVDMPNGCRFYSKMLSFIKLNALLEKPLARLDFLTIAGNKCIRWSEGPAL